MVLTMLWSAASTKVDSVDVALAPEGNSAREACVEIGAADSVAAVVADVATDVDAHCPLRQLSPNPQATPQPPQLLLSVLRLTHQSPHFVWLRLEHSHRPFRHVSPE